jgi:hypothetical protein
MLTSPAPSGDRAVLEDATGRRGRWMRRLGRTAALLVFGWLVVLVVGGLGLTPVANLPFAEVLRPSQGPEPLAVVPKPRRPSSDDLRAAQPSARVTTTPTETVAVSTPARPIRPAQSQNTRRFVRTAPHRARRVTRQIVSPPARAQPARPALPTGTTTAPPGQTRTASRGRSAQAPGHSDAPPPGQSASPPGQATTSPGQSASAPGQAKKTAATTTTTETVTTPGPKGPKKP